ncbi:bZIP transcription factor 27-like [Ipomoea triloba]|uniref:bZIP transcription factor 27-like n=1 Tax=Ipomoea triloba TaxID=35885 RepID=UPI00125D13AC|nr:bZIP transcription factor 27-like [Ipomoea triloba]
MDSIGEDMNLSSLQNGGPTSVKGFMEPINLSLNLVSDLPCYHNLEPLTQELHNAVFDDVLPTSNIPPPPPPASVTPPATANGGGKRSPPPDQKRRRLIKNRISAARSRARKQAYTRELELEVAQLSKENARLKKQHHELSVAAADHRSLRRTSSSPF